MLNMGYSPKSSPLQETTNTSPSRKIRGFWHCRCSNARVVAAAIRTNAQYIVTDNLKHFSEDTLEELDIEHGSADKLLASTYEHYELEALSIIREHKANLRSKRIAPEYLKNLISKGLPLLSARMKPHRDAI